MLRRRAAEAAARASKSFMSMIEFVPAAEFDADLAEHTAALEAGETLTPPQRRALEAAQRQRSAGSAPPDSSGGVRDG